MNPYTTPKRTVQRETTNQLYNIEYWINGYKRETIFNKPVTRALCNWKKKLLANTTHRAGLLLVVPITPAEKRVQTITL